LAGVIIQKCEKCICMIYIKSRKIVLKIQLFLAIEMVFVVCIIVLWVSLNLFLGDTVAEGLIRISRVKGRS